MFLQPLGEERNGQAGGGVEMMNAKYTQIRQSKERSTPNRHSTPHNFAGILKLILNLLFLPY